MKKLLLTITMVAAMAAAVQAVPTLTISDGATSVNVTDGVAPDADLGTAGSVVYINASFGGNWRVVITGITKPATGTASLPSMELHVSADRLVAGANTLTITFAETTFGPIAAGTFAASVGGNAGGTLRVVDSLNATVVADTGVLTGSPFPAFNTTAAAGPAAAPATLSMVATITDSVVGSHTGFDSSLNFSVPDGGSTLLLLGGALGSLGLVTWRRKA